MKNRMQELAGIKTKKVFVLIGPPSVGKSTYISNNFNQDEIIVVSRDNIADSEAKKNGLTYDDLFLTPSSDAIIGQEVGNLGVVVKDDNGLYFSKIREINDRVNSKLHGNMIQAINDPNRHAVIDMTNMSRNSRKRILKLAGGAPKIAVVFNFQSSDAMNTIKAAAEKRANIIKSQGGSKTISSDVFDKMVGSYVEPTREEGFDEIIYYDSIPSLKKFLS